MLRPLLGCMRINPLILAVVEENPSFAFSKQLLRLKVRCIWRLYDNAIDKTRPMKSARCRPQARNAEQTCYSRHFKPNIKLEVYGCSRTGKTLMP